MSPGDKTWINYHMVSTAGSTESKSMWTKGEDESLPTKAQQLVAPRCIDLDILIGERSVFFGICYNVSSGLAKTHEPSNIILPLR